MASLRGGSLRTTAWTGLLLTLRPAAIEAAPSMACMHVRSRAPAEPGHACRVDALREWPVIVAMLLGDSLGEAAWTDLLLVLRYAARKACGGLLSIHQPEGK